MIFILLLLNKTHLLELDLFFCSLQLSDCLLYTIYTSSVAGLRVKYELPLSGMKVQPHHDTQGDATEFSIITNTRSFTLRAKYVKTF